MAGRPDEQPSNRASAVDNPYIRNVQNFILTFTSILYEALPFIILGAVIAGILEEMLPQKLITRFLPRSRTLAILIGGAARFDFPHVRVRHHPGDAPPHSQGIAA